MMFCVVTDAVGVGVFGLSSTREAIQKAVKATAGLSAGERKKQIRQLQLRWHPGTKPQIPMKLTSVEFYLCYFGSVGG
jgi:hypothetical protein